MSAAGGVMDVDEARVLAEGLMREHGLIGWRLVFDHARTRAGVCRFGSREIGLSQVLTAMHSEELVRGTVLHEIAHALVGPRHGHDAVWRARARALGGDGERCLDLAAPRAPAPWVGTCLRGHEVLRHRRPTRPSSCSRCSATFDVAHLIGWRLHGRTVPLPAPFLAELATLAAAGVARVPVPAYRRTSGATWTGRPPAGAPLPVGTPVVLGGGGKYSGLAGRIEKRGRPRYQVRTPVGLVTAPFSLVRAVGG
jgi:predicted SprT family Zn-dependent metalloprotease